MESNKLKGFCESMDYKTYAKLKGITGISGISIALTNDLLLSQYPILHTSADVLMYFSAATYVGLTWAYNNGNTADTKEIRALYQEFIKNYNKLNRAFDLNDPIQIFTMYTYLLNKGYLSVDKNNGSSITKAADVRGLLGIDVISGNAVCRHNSAMLGDILNDYGIETGQLAVYSKALNLNISDHMKYAQEELDKWLETHQTDKQIDNLKFIEELVSKHSKDIQITAELLEERNIFKRIIGNHAITFAVKDEKSYYLDPTKIRMYKVSENDKKYYTMILMIEFQLN